MTVYRLHRDTRLASDYNLLSEGNRWNPARTPMLYCGATISLCCLEVLVHTDPDLIPESMVWSWAKLPTNPERSEFAWDLNNLEQTRSYGKSWVNSRRSLALLVTSVIVPPTDFDLNVLLNPMHDAYHDLRWERGGKFTFDPRLRRAI